ncbi:MAG: redoxin domain-containing protein [Gemmatimonadaceae bacterium]
MEAYRDQYAKLFNNGKKVVVLAISTDPDTAQYSWARDAYFPMLFGSDTDMAVGKLYGAANAKYKIDLRYLFVVGPDGRITHRMVPFNVLSAGSYTELQAAVDSTAGVGGAGAP